MQGYLKKCFIGASYGVSFPLTLVILDYWLKDIGASNTTIGLFTLLHSAFILKFIWGTIIENYDIPYFGKKLGRIRGWVVASHFVLVCGVVCMAFSSPETEFTWLIIGASVVAIADGCKNIVLYPYQIQNTSDSNIGYVANAISIGHRIGSIAIKVLTLHIAYFYNWKLAYLSAAVLISVIAVITLHLHVPKTNYDHNINSTWSTAFMNSYKEILYAKTGKTTVLILALYKGVDFMMQKTCRAFYIEIGVSKLEIANIVQFFGAVSVVVGGFICGYIIKRIELLKTMKFVWTMHLLSFFGYLLLIECGKNTGVLIWVIFFEGITGGGVTAAFLAFLYQNCKKESQYAILWAIHEACGIMFMTLSGFIVDLIGWKYYFAFIPMMFAPMLLLLRSREKVIREANGCR